MPAVVCETCLQHFKIISNNTQNVFSKVVDPKTVDIVYGVPTPEYCVLVCACLDDCTPKGREIGRTASSTLKYIRTRVAKKVENR